MGFFFYIGDVFRISNFCPKILKQLIKKENKAFDSI